MNPFDWGWLFPAQSTPTPTSTNEIKTTNTSSGNKAKSKLEYKAVFYIYHQSTKNQNVRPLSKFVENCVNLVNKSSKQNLSIVYVDQVKTLPSAVASNGIIPAVLLEPKDAKPITTKRKSSKCKCTSGEKVYCLNGEALRLFIDKLMPQDTVTQQQYLTFASDLSSQNVIMIDDLQTSLDKSFMNLKFSA